MVVQGQEETCHYLNSLCAGADMDNRTSELAPGRLARRRLIVGLAMATLPAAAFARPPLTMLFDGRTVAGWTRVGDANWTISDGILSADRGGISFLVSERSYRDFELVAEIWVSPDANSGVFIRCSDRTRIEATNAYEVNVFDTRPDPTYGTGAIVGLAKVSPMPKAGGRWNTLRIIAQGDTFSVLFNGERTVDARDSAHAEGPIALQYGAGVVRFRKVAIRTL